MALFLAVEEALKCGKLHLVLVETLNDCGLDVLTLIKREPELMSESVSFLFLGFFYTISVRIHTRATSHM